MKILHVSAWAKTFTQFRMPMLERLAEFSGRQAIYTPDTDQHYDRLVAAGYEVITGPVSKGFSVSVPRDFFRLWRMLKREHFDAVIAHQPMGALVAIPAARLAGVPARIYSTGGLKYVPDMRGLPNRLMRIGETLIIRASDAVLLVNREDAATMQSLAVDSSLAHYVGPRGGCGIDILKFSPSRRDQHREASRRTLGLADDHIAVGYVGRVVWEKGLRELADAAAMLVKDRRNPNLRFCILGNGENLDDLRALVASRDLDSHFVFPGYLPDIDRYIAAFDIFILPSYREGLPISLLEAQAMGVPSVATNVRGNRELVADDETGLLVECRDPDSIAAALGRLVGASDLRKRLSAAAVENIVRNYSENALLPKTIDIIRATIERKTHPGG